MSVPKIIVPDDVLDLQKCDICLKYLSVKPVKVGKKEILCGRCVDKENADFVESYYGLFAECALFKCINHFDGCNQLLSYDQVMDHEKYCISGEYDCLICPEKSPQIPIYMLLHHVKTQHRKSFLKKNTFTVELIHLKMNLFFYRIDNHLFFIKESFNTRTKLMSLNVIGIGKHTESLKMNVTYFIRFQDETFIQFESNTCGNNEDFNIYNPRYTITLRNAMDLVTINFEIEIPSCTQVVQVYPYISEINKEVLEPKAAQLDEEGFINNIPLQNLIKTKLVELNSSDKCEWSRLLKFNPRSPPDESAHVSISSCETKLVVNQFVNFKLETFSVCYHCILCKCISKDITGNYVFKYGSLRHLVCTNCENLVKNFIDLIPLSLVIKNEIFLSVQYSCIRRCRTYGFCYNNDNLCSHYKHTLIADKPCCIGNCTFRATSVSSMIDHFDLSHDKNLSFRSENNMSHVSVSISRNETCKKMYILQYDVLIEILLTFSPASKKYYISAKICDKCKEDLNLLMHIIDDTNLKRNYLGTFFNKPMMIEDEVNLLAVSLLIL